MNQLTSINRIATLLSRFVVEVKTLNAINQYGINFLAENVLIPIFKEVYGFKNLENLNNQNNNIEGIDLGDSKAGVAYQITSSTDNEKVKHTLRQFVKAEHYKKYKTLFIYILTEKQNSYSDKEYPGIVNGTFDFSKDQHILDHRDLMRRINSITDFKAIQRIENLLESQFSDKKLETFKDQFGAPTQETVISNLLELKIPTKLYIGKLSINRNEVLKKMRNKKANDREIIFSYKKEKGLRFSADWVDYNKQILSFHDLGNKNHHLSQIVDQGTIDCIAPEEFYEKSLDHMRVFKALLKYCFSKQAHFLGIEFIHQDNLYYFAPEDENVITRGESWNSGKRSISRDVIRIKLHKKDSTPWYYTNLAFSISFKFFDNTWYVEISPEWYITKDGKQKHYWMDEQVTSFLKKKERNQHVLNHVKFIGNYLKYGKTQTDIFNDSTQQKPANFLEFIKFLTFKNAPKLNEEDWVQNENEENLKDMKDKDGTIEFDV